MVLVGVCGGSAEVVVVVVVMVVVVWFGLVYYIRLDLRRGDDNDIDIGLRIF